MGASSSPTPGGQRNTIIGVVTIVVVVDLVVLAGNWFQRRRVAKSQQQGDAPTSTEALSAIKRSWPGASLRHKQQKPLSVIAEEGYGLDGLPLAPIMPAKPVPTLLLTRPVQRDSLVQQKCRYYQTS